MFRTHRSLEVFKQFHNFDSPHQAVPHYYPSYYSQKQYRMQNIPKTKLEIIIINFHYNN